MVSRYVSNFALGLGPGNPSAHPPPHVPQMPLGVAMAATAAAAAAAAVVPQQQQQQQQQTQTLKGPNPSEYHVSPCLVQGPSAPAQAQHQHYRILHSRSDGYVAAPSAGFSQGGPPHQAPTVLRGMQSTAPSTPPQQQDLSKMNQPPSQTMYVSSGGANGTTNIRQTQQNMFRGGSSGSGQRAPRHSIPIQPAPFISQQMPPMMVQPPSYHTTYTAQRQATSQMFPPSQQYQLQQASFPANYTSYPSYITYPIQQQQRSVGVPSGIVSAGGPGLGGPNAAQQHMPMQSNNMLATIPTAATAAGSNTLNNKKRRKYAINIIDPITKRNILDEIETAKPHQSGTSSTPEVGYPESIGHTVDVVGGPMHGISEVSGTVSEPLLPGVNLGTSNTNNAQGTFIDLMNQHKISAVVPPATQPLSNVLAINESLNQTPVVSAMSDGPSVEIPPKQQSSKSKRTKNNDTMLQQPDKVADTKDLSPKAQPPAAAKTAEESLDDSSSKHTGRETASSLPIQIETSSKENHIVELSNQTKNAYADNQHQHIPGIPTQRLKQLEQSQSSNSGANDSISSDADVNSTQSDNPINKGTGLILPQSSGGLQSPDVSSAARFPPAYKENNKKNTNNNQSGQTSVSNNNVIKNHREKDKNQQASGSNNNSSVAAIGFTSDTNIEQISSSDYTCNTNSSIHNNNRLVSSLDISNETKGEKMKLNDKTDSSSTVVSNKVIPNSNVSEKNNNKKISDKNDNIIPSKSSHQNQKHQRQSQQRAVIVKESQLPSDFVSSNYNANVSSSIKTSSLCPSNSPSTWNKSDVDASKTNQNTTTSPVASISVLSKSPQNDASFDEPDRANLPAVTANKGFFVKETSIADSSNTDRFGTDVSKKPFESKPANPMDVKIKSSDVGTKASSDKNSNLVDQSVNELQVKENSGTAGIRSHDSDCNKLVTDKSTTQEHSSETSGHSSRVSGQSNENVQSTNEQESSSLVSTHISNGSNKVECTLISTNVLKSYDREQLLELRDAPLSRSKPKVNNAALSILEIGDKQSQSSLLPSFARVPSGKRQLSNSGMSLSSGNSTGGHQFLKQSSMSGVNAKSNAKGSKTGLIHVSLSLREDVKLNETENAWRPTRLKRDDNVPEAERSKDELLRKVRGILNKLTPEKFNTLVDQLMKLQIDTQDKINGVMILVFEKAIDEPNFSVSYARLCLHLAENKLASEVKKDGQKVGSDGKDSNMVLFKSALLDKTQREFTDNVLERKAKEQKLKPLIEKLKDCTDPEKRLEIKEILEEEDRKIRRRSGGTVRFIGELFKINMLTPKIIRDCIKNLLEPSSEDKLECLCKLLTTVGDRLEQLPTPKDVKNWSLDSVFKKMQAIVDRKTEWSKQISSRVRFMLQDVIDLRKNKWQSKRNDMNPKTMEQIQKEAESEQYNNQFISSTVLPSKKDERRFTGVGVGNSNNVNSNNSGVSGNSNTGSGGYYNKSNRQQSSNDDDVWYTKTSKGSRVIDATKLGQICTDYGNFKINEERRLGDSAQFQWSRIKESQKPTTTTSNSFAALSNLDLCRGSNNGPRNRGSYTKNSMERDRYEGRNSRGGSIHGSRENSVSRSSGRSSNVSRSTGTSHTYSVSNAHSSSSRSVKSDVPAAVSSATVEPTLSQKFVLNDDPTRCLEEVINEMVTTAIEVSFSEAIIVAETIPERYRSDFIQTILSSYLDLSKTKEQHREKAAEIVLELYNKKFLTLDHILKGYEQFSMVASDIYIDVPELWKYVFQFIGPLLSEGVISLTHLWNEKLVEANMEKVFFKHLFMYCVQEIGPNFTREMWRKSGLSWQTVFSKDDHVQFIKDNNLEFIDANDASSPLYGDSNMNKIMAKIEKLLKAGKSEDLITDYINGNIKVIDKLFIRGLTTIVLENALTRSDRGTRLLDNEKFNKSYGVPLLQRYIDSKEEFELECLYAIQVLIHRLEYPQGLLFDIFLALFEHDAISQDAFIKWRDSPEERAAGKGVAVKGLNKFFEHMDADSTDENN